MGYILIVEDNKQYAKKIEQLLQDEGHNVDVAYDSLTGIEQVTKMEYDLVISDLMLDGIDGNRFLTFVKRTRPNMRTIILTGRPTFDTEKEALDNDIDYYLSKEIRLDILLSYINRALVVSKKQQDMQTRIISKLENVELNLKARTVKKAGQEIALTQKEFGILYLLLSNMGNAVSRESFIEELWDYRFENIEERVVDVHIKALRKKLQVSVIVSVRGYGYKWDE